MPASKAPPKKKPPLHNGILARLREIALEYEESPLDRVHEELAEEARQLIRMLVNYHVPKKARDEVEVALRAMANVLDEYEDAWREDTLTQIFSDAEAKADDEAEADPTD